jgi:hypothetical protein
MEGIHWDNEVTFGVAFVGYILLTSLVASSLLPQVIEGRFADRLSRARPVLSWATFVAASTHATMVWHLRFGWDFMTSLRNGIHSAVFFHTAWISLAVVALRARKGKSHPMLYVAWVIVAFGTTMAPFMHDWVAWLKIPMCTVTSIGLSMLAFWIHRRLRMRRPALAPLAAGR